MTKEPLSSNPTLDALRELSEVAIAHDQALFRRLRAALTWALQNGAYVVDWGSGFQHKGCGCCAYEIEPPAEIDALVREVRREIGALTTK